MHEAIARDFGNNRRAGNSVTFGITFHDRCVRDAKRAQLQSIDQHVVWGSAQSTCDTLECAVHCQHRRVVDVDPVNFTCRRRANADRQCDFANADRQAFARDPIQLFGIINTIDRPQVRRHYDGTCDNGAREGAPSDFIHTSK